MDKGFTCECGIEYEHETVEKIENQKEEGTFAKGYIIECDKCGGVNLMISLYGKDKEVNLEAAKSMARGLGVDWLEAETPNK